MLTDRVRWPAAACFAFLILSIGACQWADRVEILHPPFAEEGARLEIRRHVIDFPSPHVVESFVWVREGQLTLAQSAVDKWIEVYAQQYRLDRTPMPPDALNRNKRVLPINHMLDGRFFMYYLEARCLVAVDPIVIVEIDRPIQLISFHRLDLIGSVDGRSIDYDPHAVIPEGIYASSVLPPGRVIRWYRPRDLSTPPQTPPEDWKELELTEDLILVRRADGGGEVRRK